MEVIRVNRLFERLVNIILKYIAFNGPFSTILSYLKKKSLILCYSDCRGDRGKIAFLL